MINSKMICALLTLLFLQACHLSPKKETPQPTSHHVLKLTSKIQVMEGDTKKSVAKGLWHLKDRQHLRLDITGPFDLLLAQVFVTPDRTTIVDHSKKRVREVISHDPVDIHGVTIRPIDLVAFMQKQQPPKGYDRKSWSCAQVGPSWTCVQGLAKASWINADQFFMEIPGKSLMVTVLDKVTLEIDSTFFEARYPSHYIRQP